MSLMRAWNLRCDKTGCLTTYFRVSGVALPLCRGPSEPTSASPPGLIMNGDAESVVCDESMPQGKLPPVKLMFWVWRGKSKSSGWDVLNQGGAAQHLDGFVTALRRFSGVRMLE